MLKVGIVGVGNIAMSCHVPAYKKLADRVKIVAVADINFERAKAAAEKIGCEAYASVEDMLAKADIDYVDICTWNREHASVAIAAANAGKAILCEKPMSNSLENSLAMKRAVEENGVPFMMAMVTRYGVEVGIANEMRESGRFGDIYLAKAVYTRRRGTPRGWFTDQKRSGGGPVIDLGVHCIDRAWYLMGRPRPVSVSASCSYAIGEFNTKGVERWTAFDRGDGTFDTEDSATAYIRFENGAVMIADVAWAQNDDGENYIKLYGSKAGVSFDPLTIKGENAEGYLADERVPIENDGGLADCFRNEIAHFLDCLETGKQPMSSLEDGVSLQKILDGIYRSAAEHKEVTV